GRVKKINAGIQGLLDQGPAGLFIEHPFAPFARSISHGAEANSRHFQAGRAKVYVIHGSTSRERLGAVVSKDTVASRRNLSAKCGQRRLSGSRVSLRPDACRARASTPRGRK